MLEPDEQLRPYCRDTAAAMSVACCLARASHARSYGHTRRTASFHTLSGTRRPKGGQWQLPSTLSKEQRLVFHQRD